MAVEIILGGTYPLLDGDVEPLYLWDMLVLGNGVEPYMQEGQFSEGWFKFAYPFVYPWCGSHTYSSMPLFI